jgi:Uma2 family endonuclease
MLTKHGVTIEEYLALPERKPYLEYDDGEVVQKMAADFFHSAVAERLLDALKAYRRYAGGWSGPETRVELRRDGHPVRYYVPDVAYWAQGRPIRGPRAMHRPTLAVEILSPDESRIQQRRKCRIYRAHGVDVAWFVDPWHQVVEVFEGERDGDTLNDNESLTSPALSGFSMRVEELFEGLNEVPIYD